MAAREKVRAGMMELGHQKGKQKVVDCSGETEDPWKQERKAQQTLEQREMQEPQKMAAATTEGKGQPRHLHSAGSDLALRSVTTAAHLRNTSTVPTPLIPFFFERQIKLEKHSADSTVLIFVLHISS